MRSIMKINDAYKGTKNKSPELEGLLNRKDVARLLGVSIRTIYNWERRGLIRVIPFGGKRYYLTESVLAALERLES